VLAINSDLLASIVEDFVVRHPMTAEQVSDGVTAKALQFVDDLVHVGNVARVMGIVDPENWTTS
jgi:hypothetical protein